MNKYKCPECNWIGTENDMEADYITYYDEEGMYDQEVWSNWICASCNAWHQLEEYTKVEE